MDEALDLYRSQMAAQPACDPASFKHDLARYRAGDEMGARMISASCLRLAMQLAERHASESTSFRLLDVIQEANRGLWEAVTTYPGDDLDEFLHFVEERINERLAVLA